MSEEQRLILPIIDSHIHLYTKSDVDRLAWCHPDHPLAGQFSVEQFKQATQSAPSLLGYICIEANRKNDEAAGVVDGSGWEGPLEELRLMKRIALGTPNEGEGHAPEDAKMCLGLVPWAPLPAGPDVMERYIDIVKEKAGEAWPKIKGFRYLLQDKPHGVALEPNFIESLKLLGRRGFIFEVGVDQHRRGKKQLEEVLEMIGRAHEGVPEEERVTLILNHLCKPDLTLYNVTSDPSFAAWRNAMFALSKCSRTYMKLSGAFAEMSDSARKLDPARLFQSLYPWLGIVLATFGSRRIIYASDWPVCTAGFQPEHNVAEGAWFKWREVVEKMCWMASLDDEERAMIFGGTAKAAYKL